MTALRNLEVHRIDQAQIEIRWEMKGQTGLVSIYEGSTPDRIDTDAPVAQVPCESVVLRRPEEEGRRYYKVVPQAGSGKIVAERLVPFEQIRNFRDLGGYDTANGRTVRWGMVYRSGELSQPTETDLAHLSDMGMRAVFDLRSPAVVRERPDRLLGSGARLVGQAMDDEETSRWVTAVLAGCVSDTEATQDMMVQS
jgi:protein-tyrosine phosphatase